MKIDKLLEQAGLKYEELTPAEKETIHGWIDVLKESQITVESIKKHIRDMKFSVEEKLAVAKLSKDQDLFLKARLRNYMLLDSLMSSHDKAKKAIDNQLKGFLNKK